MLFSQLVAAQVTTGETFLSETHGRWESYGVVGKGRAVARIATRGDQDQSYLTIDAYPPGCTQDFSILYPYDEPLNADIQRIDINLTIRVDSNYPYDGTGVYQGSMGDSFGFVTLAALPKFRDLLTEFGNGNTVRIKFDTGRGPPPIISYSLSGFGESFGRLLKMCHAMADIPPPGAPRAPKPHPKAIPHSPLPGMSS